LNRKTSFLAAALAVALCIGQSSAWAAHNLITLSRPEVSRRATSFWVITGSVSVRNTTANAQTGRLTFLLFEVEADGTVVERARKDLGTVDLPAGNGSTVTVNYAVPMGREGTFIALADYASSIGPNAVPHTHCGTFGVTIP
jgi:hypothetical protein